MVDGRARERSTWTAALLGLAELPRLRGILVVINGAWSREHNNRRKLDHGCSSEGLCFATAYAPLIFCERLGLQSGPDVHPRSRTCSSLASGAMASSTSPISSQVIAK